MGAKSKNEAGSDSASRNTIGERLQWAIDRQPHEGRSRGIRLFTRRMKARAEEIEKTGGTPLVGYGLASIHGYVRDDVEPSVTFLREAAQLLSVRAEWLTYGQGSPTEEEEAARREGPEEELQAISSTVYKALGIPTEIPSGTPTIRHPEGAPEATPRFWGPAGWTPVVRQTTLRLYQYRPAWDLLAGKEVSRPSTGPLADDSWRTATQDVAAAIAAPLQTVGIDATSLELTDVADYVQAIALALQRTMYRYSPGEADDAPEVPPVVKRLIASSNDDDQEDTDGEG